MVSPSVVAAVEFGTLVHRAAVKVGSKTVLGARVGVNKKQMQEICAGNAHKFSAEILRSLASVSSRELGGSRITQMMLDMVSKIHPTTEACSLGQMRIQTPLTSAERRPQPVGR